MSDHLPIFMMRKKACNKISKHYVVGRSYLRYDRETFIHLLDHMDWAEFENSEDPNIQWDHLLLNMTKALDLICPIRELRVVDNKPEWLTNELLVNMRQQDKAFKRARRTNNHEDWGQARHLRNEVSMQIKTDKANVIKGKLEQHENNPKKCWREINKLLPGTGGSLVSEIHDEDTGHSIDNGALKDHINEYFSTIGEKLANKCVPDRTIQNFNII